MFSEGAVAPFMFCDVIHILALSLALFGCSFVCWLPWFMGLILGIGYACSGWVLRARWVLLCVLTWVCALVRFTGFRALSGMWYAWSASGGVSRSQCSIYLTTIEWGA